jgi:hypothetical protein
MDTSADAIARILSDAAAAGHEPAELLARSALRYEAARQGVSVEDGDGPMAEALLDRAARKALEHGLPVSVEMRDRIAEVLRDASVTASSGFDGIEEAMRAAFAKHWRKFSLDYTMDEFIEDALACNLVKESGGDYEIVLPARNGAAPKLAPLTETVPGRGTQPDDMRLDGPSVG